MITPRSFPRYDVSNYKLKFKTESFENLNLKINDVSLSGMLVSSSQTLPIESKVQAQIKHRNQQFSLFIYPIWRSKDNGADSVLTGFGFSFENCEEYQKWLKFIESLHAKRSKKLSKNL